VVRPFPPAPPLHCRWPEREQTPERPGSPRPARVLAIHRRWGRRWCGPHRPRGHCRRNRWWSWCCWRSGEPAAGRRSPARRRSRRPGRGTGRAGGGDRAPGPAHGPAPWSAPWSALGRTDGSGRPAPLRRPAVRRPAGRRPPPVALAAAGRRAEPTPRPGRPRAGRGLPGPPGRRRAARSGAPARPGPARRLPQTRRSQGLEWSCGGLGGARGAGSGCPGSPAGRPSVIGRPRNRALSPWPIRRPGGGPRFPAGCRPFRRACRR